MFGSLCCIVLLESETFLSFFLSFRTHCCSYCQIRCNSKAGVCMCVSLGAQASGQVLTSESAAVCCCHSGVHLGSGVPAITCIRLPLSVSDHENHCLTSSMAVAGVTETDGGAPVLPLITNTCCMSGCLLTWKAGSCLCGNNTNVSFNCDMLLRPPLIFYIETTQSQ